MRRSALGLWLALLSAFPARGADLKTILCWADYARLGRPIPTGNWDAVPHPTGQYNLGQKVLAAQKKALSPEEYEKFLDWYYDHFFSERWITLQDNLGSKENQFHRSTRYDVNGERPFDGYFKARAGLAAKSLADIGLDEINDAHRDMLWWRSVPGSDTFVGWFLSANSERTPSKALGKPRSIGVGFHTGAADRDLTKLVRPTTGEPPKDSPADITHIDQVNPFLRFRAPESENDSGWVDFMPIAEWRRFEPMLTPALRRRLLDAEVAAEALPPPSLAAREADLLKEIQKEERENFLNAWEKIVDRFERGRIDGPERERRIHLAEEHTKKTIGERFEEERKKLQTQAKKLDWAASPELRQDFVSQVFKFRWDKVKSDLKKAKTQQEVIDLVGDFYYDFVSIHPYRNGNGRMGRLLAERLLEHYNLPPPVWTHLGEDVLLAKGDFLKLFRDAVDVSRQFHTDLDRLMNAGIPFTGANIDLTAGQVLPQVVERYPVDTDEFLTWVAAGSHEYKSMRLALTAFHSWRESLDYERGQGRGVRLANSLFTGSFGRTSPNQAAYDAKLERFYAAKGKVARAVETNEVPDDQALLKHFSELTTGTSPAIPVAPAAGFTSFNTTLVRTPGQVRRWPDGWFGSAASAERAGVVKTYWSGAPIPETLPTGDAQAVISVVARRRETATVDQGKETGELGRAHRDDNRVVLHAVGIDPESVLEVEVKETGSSRRRVAERTSFNRVEIREYAGTHLVSTKKYLLLKDGTWKPQ